jgi:hypothetical protein
LQIRSDGADFERHGMVSLSAMYGSTPSRTSVVKSGAPAVARAMLSARW